MGDHQAFMRAAIAEAKAGAARGNFPVGSVVVRDGERVVIGALFPPTGGVRSQARILDLMGPLVHPVEVVAEVLPEECLGLLPPGIG